MEQINLQHVIERIRKTVKECELENEKGAYRRYSAINDAGEHNMGKNEYGYADAIRVLEDFAAKNLNRFLTADYETPTSSGKGFHDLRYLFGVACCFAELQQAHPRKDLNRQVSLSCA